MSSGARDRVQVGYGPKYAGNEPTGGMPRYAKEKSCTTGKRRYGSQLEALQALTRCKNLGRPERGYYECRCGYFHLTSQDPGTIGMVWKFVRE